VCVCVCVCVYVLSVHQICNTPSFVTAAYTCPFFFLSLSLSPHTHTHTHTHTQFVPFETRYPPEWIDDPSSTDPKMVFADVPISETWAGMEGVHAKGLAKNIGVSNFNAQVCVCVCVCVCILSTRCTHAIIYHLPHTHTHTHTHTQT
jgi:hypothetical protein